MNRLGEGMACWRALIDLAAGDEVLIEWLRDQQQQWIDHMEKRTKT